MTLLNKQKIQRLLFPKSIVVIGGSFAEEAMRQSIKMGFDGDIFYVHPKKDEVLGTKCYKSVTDLPYPPDAAFVGVSNTLTIGIVEQLSQIGVGGAVCYASGFDEYDDAGSQLQKELLEVAGDMPLVGPNCYGMVNYLNGACLWPDQHGGVRCDGGVGIITQSGNIGLNMTLQKRGLDIACLIAVGNKASLDFCDYVDMFLENDKITAIGLHIESIGDAKRFSGAAIKAWQKNIPIVVIKAGKSSAGAEITLSHTSSLAGANDFYEAFFEKYNIISVDSISDFMETLKLLSISGAPKDNSYLSMSCSGGEASISADFAEKYDLDMPPLKQSSIDELQGILGEMVNVRNPLDYHTFIWGNMDATKQMIKIVAGENISTVAMILDYPDKQMCDLSAWNAVEEALILANQETTSNTKFVMITTLSESVPMETILRLKAGGITPLQDFESGIKAIKSTSVWGEKNANGKIPNELVIEQCEGENIVLNEFEGKTAVAKFGLTVPNGKSISIDNVETGDLSYPVVAKILDSNIAHKTDVGGVHLNLQNNMEVENAINEMKHLGGTFLVEEMASDITAELIIGIKRDPQFGLGLVIGAGGVMVEILKDSKLLLLPATKDEIKTALSGLKMYPLLNGYRGSQPVNIDKCVEAIYSVGEYANSEINSLMELDINPLFVGVEGTIAGDVLIRLTK